MSARLSKRIGRRQRAFTIVEVLIASALTAMVMVALCAAVSSTMKSCKDTGSILEASGRAKLALNQLERTVRKASAVVKTSNTRLDVVDESGNAIAFIYDAANKVLNLQFGPTASTTTAVLARNVTGLSYVAESQPDPNTQVMRIVRLTVNMTITASGESKLFTTSIAPRRARTYQ